MVFTIDLTSSEEARLRAGAERRGMAPAEFLKHLITDHLPENSEMTFGEILAPAHEYSRNQKDTEEELGVFADTEVAAYRAERRAKQESGGNE